MANGNLDALSKCGVEGSDPATRAGEERRARSKDEVVSAHLELLGRVPDSEVARLAGVSVRTVAAFRARLGIAGYAGPRRPPPKRGGLRSTLDPLVALVGVVPDRVVAEQAGTSIGAVRAFRVARGIEASGPRASAEIRAVIGAWQAQPGKPAGAALGAWQVRTDDGTDGIVFAPDAQAALQLAGRSDRVVLAIEYVGEMMALPIATARRSCQG